MARRAILDTTAAVDLHCFTDKRDRIQKVVSEFDEARASQYVLMEYRKGVLQALIFLHGTALRAQHLGEALAGVNRLITHQGRKAQQCMQALIAYFGARHQAARDVPASREILAGKGRDEAVMEDLRDYLEDLIIDSWMTMAAGLDDRANEMDCFKDMKAPALGQQGCFESGGSRCTSSKVDCAILQYINAHAGRFDLIRERLKALGLSDQENARRTAAIRRLLKRRSGVSRNDREDCWKAGDAVIAVSTPPDSTLLHNNAKDLVPICDAIGVSQRNYMSDI